jgi:hypothetical protein
LLTFKPPVSYLVTIILKFAAILAKWRKAVFRPKVGHGVVQRCHFISADAWVPGRPAMAALRGRGELGLRFD